MLRQHKRTKSLKDRCYGPEADGATAEWVCGVEVGTARDQELSGALYDQELSGALYDQELSGALYNQEDRKRSTKMWSCAQLSGSVLSQALRGPHSQVQMGHHLFQEAFTSFSFC